MAEYIAELYRTLSNFVLEITSSATVGDALRLRALFYSWSYFIVKYRIIDKLDRL